jgi:hypothetical protein
MIKNIFKIVLISYCFFISCKGNEEKKVIIKNIESASNNSSKDSSVKAIVSEIYIGKTFFSGDELNNFTVVDHRNIEQIDSLSYSIYKKNDSENYIFSLEKFLKNEDVEKYKIIDTLNLKSKKVIIDLKKLNDFIILNLKTEEGLIKKWKFKNYSSFRSYEEWKGIYEGSFLRLKDESADPRAWGQIKLEINAVNAKLSIDSYVENIEVNMELIGESNEELKFKELSSNKTIILTKKIDKILLEGDFIESIVGIKEQYQIKKIKK